MAETTPIAKIKAEYKQLKDIRSRSEKAWLDAKTYVVPHRGRAICGDLSESSVDRPTDDTKRINGTATDAIGVLSSGMQSGLTSKARQWFLFKNSNVEINKNYAVRSWYDTVQDILENIFRGSNAYSCLHQLYEELAAFGTAALGVYEHPSNTIYCRTFTIGSYFVGTNEYNEVDTFFQREMMTVSQIVGKYGLENCSDTVKNAYESNRKRDLFEVVNAVLREPSEFGINSKEEDFPVASVHFLANAKDDEPFLKVSHYRSFPIMVARWDITDNDTYGYSPTDKSMGDIKMLQKLESDSLKGVAKIVSPPMRAPSSLARRGLNTSPGALNVVDGLGDNVIAPIYATTMDIQAVEYKIEKVENRIKEGYYNSLFLALLSQDNPQMTAREVAERHEEKMLMLGPVLERIHSELLDPLIDRVFGIAWDRGMIPEMPMELDSLPTQIEYVSILSQAQKAVGVNRIEQSLTFLGSLISVVPELRHALKPYEIFDEYNNMIGTKTSIFNSKEDYEKLVEAERKASKQQAQLQQGQMAAETARTLNEVNPAKVSELLNGSSEAMVF